MNELTLAWGLCSLLALTFYWFSCWRWCSIRLSIHLYPLCVYIYVCVCMCVWSDATATDALRFFFGIPCVSWIASVSLPASGCRLELASNCEGLISIAFQCQPWGVCWCGLLMLWVDVSHFFLSLIRFFFSLFSFICSICEAKHRLNHHLLGASFPFCSIFVTTASTCSSCTNDSSPLHFTLL